MSLNFRRTSKIGSGPINRARQPFWIQQFTAFADAPCGDHALCALHPCRRDSLEKEMELMDALYGRRSVRAYKSEPVDRALVEKLIDAAIQAPSKMNAQPWAFAVIGDRALLTDLSQRSKAHLLRAYGDEPLMDRYREDLSNPAFDIFYGAGTLIVICASPEGLLPAEDCCLAAQNLMLAAHGSGLGTCCIGWARPFLALPETKDELGIPRELDPVLPIIVGVPKGPTPAPPRNEARFVVWK